jgi:20S proteasome alpha/beta subunit
MTYVATFRCKEGIVMCADTQVTIGEYKNYVEKIAIAEDNVYPIAVGGAGAGELIDALSQEIIECTKESKPTTKDDLKRLVKNALREVWRKDVPTLVVPKQYRSPELLIAARTTEEGSCILWTRGRRLLGEQARGIIGYPSAYNFALLTRLHSESLPMAQAVLLATYLVSQSKMFDEGVGGETQIVVVTDKGAFQEDRAYVDNAQKRFDAFHEIVDRLILASPDVSTTEAEFLKELEDFRKAAIKLRAEYKHKMTAELVNEVRTLSFRLGPYFKLPKEMRIKINDENAVPSFETEEPSQPE